MKIVLIGGSSPSTPVLIQTLAKIEGLPSLNIILLARNQNRLRSVNRASQLLANQRPITVSYTLLSDPLWMQTLIGADVIVLQVRVGGYPAREFDESFPVKYGICGDQDLGPGGFSGAWRSWPIVEHFFIDAYKYAPKAVFLVLSSPVGLLVRLGARVAPRLNIMGICELPWTTLNNIRSIASTSAGEFKFSYVGLHHLGWFYRLLQSGTDMVEKYASGTDGSLDFPSTPLIRRLKAIPTRYSQLHYEPAKMLEIQKRAIGTRSLFLAKFQEMAIDIFRRGNAEEIKNILRTRPAPWYSEAIGPFIAARSGLDVNRSFFLTRPNTEIGVIRSLDDVLELSYIVQKEEVQVQYDPQPVPDEICDTIIQFLYAERIAADSIIKKDPLAFSRALASHPWTEHDTDTKVMADEIVEKSKCLAEN